MSEIRVTIFDEVNARVDGIPQGYKNEIVKKFTFHDYRLKHLPVFRRYPDIHRVEFFRMNGRTYTNILPEVIEEIDRLLGGGVEFEIEDRRKKYEFDFDKIDSEYLARKGIVWKKGHALEGKHVILRDYQVDIVNRFLENMQGIQEIATGAGKTVMIATLCKVVEVHGRTLVVVPNKSLVKQTYDDFTMLNLDTGMYYGDSHDIGHNHMIVTWQSLKSAYDRRRKEFNQLVEDLVCIIVDEVHGAKAHVLRKLLSGPLANVPLRFGLTGTMPSNEIDRLSIIVTLGRVIGDLKTSTLQRNGVLSECEIYPIIFEDKHPPFETYHEENSHIVNDPDRLSWLADFIETIATDGNTLVLVQNVNVAKTLAEKTNGHLVYGKVDTEVRKRIFEIVNNEDGQILVATYGTASVGIDIPRLFNIVMFETGKSPIRVLQSIGRGVRKTKDKNIVRIYDISTNLKWSSKHRKERMKLYRNSEFPCADPIKIKEHEWRRNNEHSWF